MDAGVVTQDFNIFISSLRPVTRLTTPHVPLPSADILEDNTIPSVDVIVQEVIKKVKGE